MSGIPYNRLQTIELTVETDNGETVVIETLHYAFVVLCRDCKHYEYWEFRDGRTAHDCARGGDYLFDTEPDGFCAWGERRQDG